MPDFVSTLIFNVCCAVVVAIAGIICRTLMPYLKAKKEEANLALRQTKWAWAADIIDAVVRAVEQTVSDGIHGDAKKDEAIRIITHFLAENHIELTQDQISAMIEAAVQQLNSNTIEVTDYNTAPIGFNYEDSEDEERD